ncbi:MAG: hypothetical protein ACLQVY_11705 [Limisphaerales bacterium]
MFDMEQALTLWRRRMLEAGIKTPVPLEELEEHLREEIEEQLALGTEAQLAFNAAMEKLGQNHALHAEFVKLDRFAFMKTFNRRLARRVLGGLIAFDAAFFILSHIFPGMWAVAPWWIVNAPGFPVAFFINSFLPLNGTGSNYLLIGTGVFSSLVWSALLGYMFRSKTPESYI